MVRLDFVDQPDAAPFLTHVQHDAQPLFFDHVQRLSKLFSAVASRGPEHVAGQALRMNPDQNVFLARRLALTMARW